MNAAGLAAVALAAALTLRPMPSRRRMLAACGSTPGRSTQHPLLACAVVAVAATGSPIVMCAVVAAWLGAARWRRRRRERVAHRQAARDARELTFALAAELRAGRPIGDALVNIAPHLPMIGAAVAVAGRAINRGAEVEAELLRVADQTTCPRMRPVVAVLTVSRVAGLAVADLLDRIGASFDADDGAANDIAAAAAGPRATVSVLLALPVFGLAIGTTLGLSPLSVLLHTRAGLLLAAVAGLLDLAGWWWVRRIMSGALR